MARPRKKRTAVDELCDQYGAEPVKFLVDVMNNEDAGMRERTKAATELMDRMYPKMKSMEVQIDHELSINVVSYLDLAKNGSIDTSSIPAAYLPSAGTAGDGVGDETAGTLLAPARGKG